MMRRSVGTNAWAALGGQLRRQDRMRLMGQAMLTRLAALTGRFRSSMGIKSAQIRQVDLQAICLPDSRVAMRASELASSLSEPWLFNHCMRTYLWGAMLAQVNNIRFDEELFYTASVLHDLGLTSTHLCKDTSCSCFAVEGARAARQFVSKEGWTNQRCDQLAEAISLHLNVRVGLNNGAEAHLLHAGTSLDIIGARAWQLDTDTVSHVQSAYPKLSLKTSLVDAMKNQARARPTSRAAFLVGLGFIGLLRAAP